MSWIRGFLGALVILLPAWGALCPAAADSAAPVKGAFVTLEKASGGVLKYTSSGADGTFIIEDLPKGNYRMSLTPPAGDRKPGFSNSVQVAFKGLEVRDWGRRTKGKEGESESALFETGVEVAPQLWTSGVVWLDVKVTDRTVTGKFTYLD